MGGNSKYSESGEQAIRMKDTRKQDIRKSIEKGFPDTLRS
jgi:hypothetical protein